MNKKYDSIWLRICQDLLTLVRQTLDANFFADVVSVFKQINFDYDIQVHCPKKMYDI